MIVVLVIFVRLMVNVFHLAPIVLSSELEAVVEVQLEKLELALTGSSSLELAFRVMMPLMVAVAVQAFHYFAIEFDFKIKFIYFFLGKFVFKPKSILIPICNNIFRKKDHSAGLLSFQNCCTMYLLNTAHESDTYF